MTMDLQAVLTNAMYYKINPTTNTAYDTETYTTDELIQLMTQNPTRLLIQLTDTEPNPMTNTAYDTDNIQQL